MRFTNGSLYAILGASMSLELPGLATEQARRLEEAGLRSVEALLAAGPERLVQLSGITPAQADDLLESARRWLDADQGPVLVASDEPRIVTLPDADAEGGLTRRLARGLDAARRIEETHDLVRRAREHARAAASTPARWKARRQLKRLRRWLEEIQQRVLSKGLGGRPYRQLEGVLDPLDAALRDFIDATPKKKALQEIRQVVKVARSTELL